MLLIVEEDGGLGGGLVEVMVVVEGFGWYLMIDFWVLCCVFVLVFLYGGGDVVIVLVIVIGVGDVCVVVVLIEVEGGYDLYCVGLCVEWIGGGYCLLGVKVYVEDGVDVDWFIVFVCIVGGVVEVVGISLFFVFVIVLGLVVECFCVIDGYCYVWL